MDLLSLARELNPWWTGTEPKLPAFTRDIVLDLVAYLQPTVPATERRKRAIVLSGLRGVGKTKSLLQTAARLAKAANRPQDVMYFDLSDPRVLGATLEELLASTGFLSGSANQKVLLLDEVAHDPNWTESIKRLVDLEQGAPGIVVADSAAAKLRTSAAGESALGRRDDRVLEPLSFAEVARSRGLFVSDPRDADGFRLGELAEEYLLRGGMPDSVFGPDGQLPPPLEMVHQRLREDAEVAISRDAPRVREVREIEPLRQVWSVLARGISLALNLSTLCRDLGISKQTVQGLLGLLRDILIVRELSVYGGGPKTPVRHPPRFVVADTGLAAAHLLRAALHDPTLLGQLVEAAVSRHLSEVAARHRLPRPSYARNEGGRGSEEVDFVLEQLDPGVVSVETKYGTKGDDQAVIRRFAERSHAIQANLALLVTRNPILRRSTVDGMTVYSVPLWRFLCWPEKTLQGELEP